MVKREVRPGRFAHGGSNERVHLRDRIPGGAGRGREGFAQPVAGRRLILRAIRRYALSCRRQPHPPVELGSARRRWEALPLTREGS